MQERPRPSTPPRPAPERDETAGGGFGRGLGYGDVETGAAWAGPGGQQRGFGRGEYGHPRHRGQLGDVGRSAVYGQPTDPRDPYPGRPVERETSGEPSHRRKGPKGYRRSDERIQEFICERLVRYHWLDLREVSVAVRDGEVSLEGTVPERRMKYAIEDVAAGCWGVGEVVNRLRVSTPEAPAGDGGEEPGQWPGSARPAAARAAGSHTDWAAD